MEIFSFYLKYNVFKTHNRCTELNWLQKFSSWWEWAGKAWALCKTKIQWVWSLTHVNDPGSAEINRYYVSEVWSLYRLFKRLDRRCVTHVFLLKSSERIAKNFTNKISYNTSGQSKLTSSSTTKFLSQQLIPCSFFLLFLSFPFFF